MRIGRTASRLALALTLVTFCVTPSLYVTNHALPSRLLCMAAVMLAAWFGGLLTATVTAGSLLAIDAVSVSGAIGFASTSRLQQIELAAGLAAAALVASGARWHVDRKARQAQMAAERHAFEDVSRQVTEELAALEARAAETIARANQETETRIAAAIDAFREQQAEHQRLTEQEIEARVRRRIAAAAAEAEEKSRTELFSLMASLERRTALEREEMMRAAQDEVTAARAEVRDATRELLDFQRTQLEEIAAAKESFTARIAQERAALEQDSKVAMAQTLAKEKLRLEEAVAAEMQQELERRRAELRVDIDRQLDDEKRALAREVIAAAKREREHVQTMIRRFGAERLHIARAMGDESPQSAAEPIVRTTESEAS